MTIRRIRTALAILAVAPLVLASSARAQSYSTPQGSPQASPQWGASYPCACPFPQGYCPFPGGYCALPASYCGTPMASMQGGPSSQMAAPSMQAMAQNYGPKPYGAPTPYTAIPLGIPMNSMPSMQGGYAAPTIQSVPGKAW